MIRRLNKLMFLLVCPLLLTACSSDEPANGPDNPFGTMEEEWELTTTLSLNQTESQDMQQLNDNFNYMLLNHLSKKYGSDFCVSPISLSIYLSLVANIADDVSQKEILDALNVSDLETLNSLNAKLMHYLPNGENGSKIDVYNRFWVAERIKVSESISSLLKTNYNAYFDYVDFTQSQTLPQINSWISNKTNGLIVDFFGTDWRQYLNSQFLTANIVYFKGEWSKKFDKSLTGIQVFHSPSGDKEIEMMHNRIELTSYSENEFVHMVELKYKNGTNYIKLYLPKEGISISEAIEALNPEENRNLNRNSALANVTISLPKFKINNGLILGDFLKEMGIKSGIKTSGIGEAERLGVVFQHVALNLDEDGTEMAAATSDKYMMNPQENEPIEVTIDFDRPFFYKICNENGPVLVAGTVVNP